MRAEPCMSVKRYGTHTLPITLKSGDGCALCHKVMTDEETAAVIADIGYIYPRDPRAVEPF